MKFFNKKLQTITVVHNDELHFAVDDLHGNWIITDSLRLDQFENGNIGSDFFAEELLNRDNFLMVVPDYWFSNTTYKLQSNKKSIVEAFIKRKLRVENPDLSEIEYFFDYTFYKTDTREGGLYVYFMQEPGSFQLYNKLAEFNLSPHRITTAAYLWEEKLKKTIPDFHEAGSGLVHLCLSGCYLYFFFQGRFIFSRSITLSDTQTARSERFSSLTYELNQSFYLFSQKAKAEIDRLYLLPCDQKDAQELSDILGRDVIDFSSLPGGKKLQSTTETDKLGPVSPFNTAELTPSGRYPSISHKLYKKELDWKPVQTAGIIAGLILLLLLGVESFILLKWFYSSRVPTPKAGIAAKTDPKQIIDQYNDALDSVLMETNRPFPAKILIKTAESLPDNVWIKEIFVELDPNRSMELNSIIKAKGPDNFKDSLSLFLSGLNKNFQGIQPVQIQDVDFKIDKSRVEKGYQHYLITVKFDLP